MKIGVLSDTHDSLSNVIYAVETMRDRGIETVIHCGDLTDLILSPDLKVSIDLPVGEYGSCQWNHCQAGAKHEPDNLQDGFTGMLDGSQWPPRTAY